jgi:hypothetical protein
MCFETELSEMPNGAATSVTRASPEASRFSIERRVSSASATSVSSRSMADIFTQKDEYVNAPGIDAREAPGLRFELSGEGKP